MSDRSTSPPAKRAKLEPRSPSAVPSDTKNIPQDHALTADEDADVEFQCSICLQEIVDRTVIPTCSHEFCFECLKVWSEQSRRCPLCSQSIGEYLIHNIRSKYDFRRHHLTPLRTSPPPEQRRTGPVEVIRRRRTARDRERERRFREERETTDKLERSIEKRRWVYRHDLYAKHVASNSYTRYRPYPTPAQFAASPELISKATTFLRRELRVWDHLDVEFLTTFTISMMKSIDIRSESAIKLLAEFLDMDAPYVEGGRHFNAEHFAHEVYSYLRSPFRDLFVYDTAVQYDAVPETSPSPGRRRGRSGQVGRLASAERDGPRVRSKERRRRRRERSNDVREVYEPSTSADLRPRQRSDEDVARGSRGRTAKGKERADAEADVAISENVVEVASVAQATGQSDLEVPQPPLLASERKRPPRMRSLLESVQAHLTLGSSRSAIKSETAKRHHDNSSFQRNKSSTAPALLARLSDPAEILQRTQSGRTSEALTPQPGTAHRHKDSAADGQLNSQHTEISAHKTTAQTRGRVVENLKTSESHSGSQPGTAGSGSSSRLRTGVQATALLHTLAASRQLRVASGSLDDVLAQQLSEREDILGLPLTSTSSTRGRATNRSLLQNREPPVSRSQDDLHDHEVPSNTHDAAMRGNPVDERPPISTRHINVDDKSHPSTASSDPRTRTELLARLERGKRQAHCAADTRVNEAVSAPGDAAVAAQAVETTRAIDPQLMEEKLRRLAQLQVRLAGEKRSSGV
ncbi:putative zinc finger, C3HC4 type (RING finger) [Lyophyllum shimeji]|uniref:RING-type E3 ubiquitin transferase n=1 Tax=Lyophyllum shimeji TaxID=47721 RepID=A0A9P3USL3_LYOSH|nr:putative zinc finger, C3HC4 type (RING finger) [Lyophyllum shimeji]